MTVTASLLLLGIAVLVLVVAAALVLPVRCTRCGRVLLAEELEAEMDRCLDCC